MCSKKIDIRKQAGFPEEQIRNPGREKESLLNATETAISLGNFQLSLNNIENSEIILKTTAAKVREIIRFKAISFYLVNEKDSSFYQAYCDPEDSSQFIEKEVKVLINEKIFSLALRANKPTIITSTASSEQIMLHPLFTSSRTRGMFLGVLEQDRENISDISLILFTTAIVINAYVLESYGLYHHIKDINKELEANVIKLEISEKELTKANNELQKDILKRKQTEEEKRRLEERLQHADKMEAIGTLAGGIAHDFNNLLMGIQGYTSLTLLNLDQDDPNRENLKRIEDQVQSGAELTRQLLGFARGGRYEVKPADMNEIIEKSSSMFGRTKKEITINKKYGDDLYAAEVDLGQMEQVLMNLYVNAWQAMPGGGNIYLETENVFLAEQQALTYAVKPGRYVKISVADTGIGMD
jgi:signal transduction histidine kinase